MNQVVSRILSNVWTYVAVIVYLFTNKEIYNFWSEPFNTDELFDYLFPENGWIWWGLQWLYWGFQQFMQWNTQFLAYISQLHYIAYEDFYR
jgi:hypothetical protein